MIRYKRNQIEEAISLVFDPRSAGPSSELRTRIKRLLELDRALGRKPRSANAEEANFAFFSEDAPGTGSDIWFSEYEAFALLNGLRIMGHGWPQSFAVSVMRQVRADLEKQHVRILKQDPKELFDWKAIRRKLRPGDIVVDTTDPVFLTIISKANRAPENQEAHSNCAICRGIEKVFALVRNEGALAWTTLEVVTVAHAMSQELAKTEPRRRGRGG